MNECFYFRHTVYRHRSMLFSCLLVNLSLARAYQLQIIASWHCRRVDVEINYVLSRAETGLFQSTRKWFAQTTATTLIDKTNEVDLVTTRARRTWILYATLIYLAAINTSCAKSSEVCGYWNLHSWIIRIRSQWMPNNHNHEYGNATRQLHCQWWSGRCRAKRAPNAAWVLQRCAPMTDTLTAGRRSISCS